MSPLTDVRNEITKAIESVEVPKPFYAVAGVGDLAIEKFRGAEQRVRELSLDERLAGLSADARALPGKVQAVQADVQGRVRELPSSVVDAAIGAGDRATAVYQDLSVRGKKLVDGFAAQRAVTITDAPKRASGAAGANGTDEAKPERKAAAKKTAAKKAAAKSANGTKPATGKAAGAKSTKATKATKSTKAAKPAKSIENG